MMGKWESPSSSQIIFIRLFYAGAQPCWRCSKVTTNSGSERSVTAVSTYFTAGSIKCHQAVVGPVQLLGGFSQVFTSFIRM